jgi:hypothetical protein
MTRVLVAPKAWDDLGDLIDTLKLPRDMRARVKRRLRSLAVLPDQGSELVGRWEGFRFVLGPWPWMLVVYTYDEEADQVSVVTIEDARSARSATSER